MAEIQARALQARLRQLIDPVNQETIKVTRERQDPSAVQSINVLTEC